MIKNLFKRGAVTVGVATIAVSAFAGTAHADRGVPYVKFGQKGDAVACVQEGLQLAGFPVTIDGKFGNDTKQKLMAFQKANHLQADGVVGPKTGDLLYYGYLQKTGGLVEEETCGFDLPTTR